MNYEIVIGTIGKTHGVKSESAPTVIASQMNDQSEPRGPVARELKTTGPDPAYDPFSLLGEFLSGGRCAAVAVSLLDAAGGAGDG